MKNALRPVHPGEILREDYLVPLKMTGLALAKALHVDPARVNQVLRGERAVRPDTALRLARFFGGDAQSWLNLQSAHDLKVTELTSAKRIAKEVRSRAID